MVGVEWWTQEFNDEGFAFYTPWSTGAAHWDEPEGWASAPSKTSATTKREKKPPPANKEDAAVRIQCMWRDRQARKKVHDIAQGVYEKVWDEEDQTHYYYNKKTGESIWTKPMALGSDDAALVLADEAGPANRLDGTGKPTPPSSSPEVPSASALIQFFARHDPAKAGLTPEFLAEGMSAWH